MEKNAFDVKIFSISATIFFTVCAGLYHYAYWSEFGINGLSFISISDFIKSYAYTAASSFGGAMFLYFFIASSTNLDLFNKWRVKELNQYVVLITSILFPVVNVTAYIVLSYKNNPAKELLWAVMISEFLLLTIKNNPFDKYTEKRLLRFYLLRVLVFLPLLSYGSGKYTAEQISLNKRYDFSVQRNSKDTLKYLGNGEDYVIFTSLNNSKNYFINPKKIDTMVMFHYPSTRSLP